MATTSPNLPPRKFSLLLDQGFPHPPGFALESVDETVEVRHLSAVAPELSRNSTPDWMLYCIAAEKGFDGMVTRDKAQVEQPSEMFVLSRLTAFSVITWRKAIDDPIREWGQLLAYLPDVKRRLANGGRSGVVILPAPTLQAENFYEPRTALGREAAERRVSHGQIQREAWAEIQGYLEMKGEDPRRFARLLRRR